MSDYVRWATRHSLIHRCNPTTTWHGSFWLLGFPPGPIHFSLDNLDIPGYPEPPMSIPSLVWTSDRHNPKQSRTPNLKSSTVPATQLQVYKLAPPSPTDAMPTAISKHGSCGIWGSMSLNRNSFESSISLENHSLRFINSIIFHVSFFTLEKLSMFCVYISDLSAVHIIREAVVLKWIPCPFCNTLLIRKILKP